METECVHVSCLSLLVCYYVQPKPEVYETLPFFITAWLTCLPILEFVPSYIHLEDTKAPSLKVRVRGEMCDWKLSGA